MNPKYRIELHELPEGWLCEIKGEGVSASAKELETAVSAAIGLWQGVPRRYPRPDLGQGVVLLRNARIKATVAKIGPGYVELQTTDPEPQRVTVTVASLWEEWAPQR